jgi:phosphoglycerate dehydrogenase-like enzyme
VRWVHSRSAGLDSVLFPALRDSPVPLTNGRGVFSEPLGEFVLGAALYFAKDFGRMVRSRQAGIWDQFDIPMLAGQTMGIVGYGDIGRAIATRAHALGMRVLALRRHPEKSGADPLVHQVYPPDRKLEMLAQSDYVAVAAPLTPETRGMIGERELRGMKQNAVIMNVGRGPVIDEAALVRALREGWIRGAALDVFDREPLPAGHAFYSLDNVLLSPHCADHTPDWLELAMKFFLEQFERFRQGQPLMNVVDKTLGY